MTDPGTVWMITAFKDFVWVPLCTVITGIVVYFHKRQEKQEESIQSLIETVGLSDKEDKDVITELRDKLLELKYKVLEVEKSVLSTAAVDDIFKQRLTVFSQALADITAMVDLISRNLEKYTEKNIRQEEQLKNLNKEVDRLLGQKDDKRI